VEPRIAAKFEFRNLELARSTIETHQHRWEGMIWKNERDAPPFADMGHKKLQNMIRCVGTIWSPSQIFQDKCEWAIPGSRNPRFD
jgi:hypothetical protein